VSASGELRTVAVVLAGGVGTRMGGDVPKQLLPLAGKPLIEHSIAVFDAAPEIDEILVVTAKPWRPRVEELVDAGGFAKVTRVLDGGATRSESTRRALAALGMGEGNVLVHDAARPLLGAAVVRACVEALERCEAVAVVVPTADTIVVVDDEGVVTDAPDRSQLRRAQTPQAFRLSTIRRAHELAAQDPHFAATDDCGVVLRYLPDVPVHAVDGSERNIKVTTPDDLVVAEALLRLDDR
jgi:2-C-methyl-D-erythritol 4-phosphate cytidylyltransferase